MLNLARLSSLVDLSGTDSRFDEFPGEYILVYVSSPGSESPKRVFESFSIQSVKLKAQFSAKTIFLIDEDDVDVKNTLHFAVRIRDLLDISVKTITGKDIQFSIPEVKEMCPTNKEISTKSADLDAELHFLVRKQVTQFTETVNNVLNLSMVAPDAINLVKLEALVHNPEFKLPQAIEDMIKSTLDGLKNGKFPIKIREGTTGVYFMQDSSGQRSVSVFKPNKEETDCPNNPFGMWPAAIREVAAYLLDHPKKGHRSVCSEAIGFAGVPPTVMVRCLHHGFNSEGVMMWKIGSLQKFTEKSRSSKDAHYSLFSVDEVQKISVLDIRLGNLDRNGDNILIWHDKDNTRNHLTLTPIDHGYCFPDSPDEKYDFGWVKWPHAKEAYSPEIEEYVSNLDVDKDIEYLKSYGWDMGAKCALMLRICTMLLKIGVREKLTAFDIGITMLTPDHNGFKGMVHEAKQSSGPDAIEAEFLHHLSSVMNRRLRDIALRKMTKL